MYLLLDSFFLFKQKSAYDMRISDWSSDVCSSDLTSIGRKHRNPLLPARHIAAPTGTSVCRSPSSQFPMTPLSGRTVRGRRGKGWAKSRRIACDRTYNDYNQN